MLAPSTVTDFHLRPILLRHDLTAVADLVEVCFSDHMDAEGRAYLQNIRRMGREGNPYYLDAVSPESSPMPFHGFVWEENGKIVGNITLIYLRKKDQNIYFIANVAVAEAYRGRGIARKLTERALQHAREHRGKTVMLQVREDNPAAIHIYASLGFDEMTRRTNWSFAARPEEANHSSAVRIRPRSSESWPQQKRWLEELYPEKVTWFLPFQLAKHEPGLLKSISRWLDMEPMHFWEAKEGNRLIGLASLERINSFQDYLWLATSPAYEETALSALLAHIGHQASNPFTILANYPAHRAVGAFQNAGMKEVNTLIWMENKLSALDRSAP